MVRFVKCKEKARPLLAIVSPLLRVLPGIKGGNAGIARQYAAGGKALKRLCSRHQAHRQPARTGRGAPAPEKPNAPSARAWLCVAVGKTGDIRTPLNPHCAARSISARSWAAAKTCLVAGRQGDPHAPCGGVKACPSRCETSVSAHKKSVPILAAEPRHFLRQYLALDMGVIAQNNAASRWQGGQGRRPVGKPVKIGHQKPLGKRVRK